MIDTIIQVPHEEERLRSGYNIVAEYRRTLNEEYGWKPVENVKDFVHDPEWRGRLMNVQCAHDAIQMDGFFSRGGFGTWFWRGIGVLFLLSSTSYWGFRLIGFWPGLIP